MTIQNESCMYIYYRERGVDWLDGGTVDNALGKANKLHTFWK